MYSYVFLNEKFGNLRSSSIYDSVVQVLTAFFNALCILVVVVLATVGLILLYKYKFYKVSFRFSVFSVVVSLKVRFLREKRAVSVFAGVSWKRS